jgi:hypothetical protein
MQKNIQLTQLDYLEMIRYNPLSMKEIR